MDKHVSRADSIARGKTQSLSTSHTYFMTEINKYIRKIYLKQEGINTHNYNVVTSC